MARALHLTGPLVLSAAVFVLAGAGLVPMPTYSLWWVHMLSLEASLAVFLLGAVAWFLAARAAPAQRSRRSTLAKTLAIAAMAISLAPALAIVPLYAGQNGRFSLSEYVSGVSARAAAMKTDQVLEPTLPHLSADLYLAMQRDPVPFVVIIHGGSWHAGDKGEGRHFSELLAARGYHVLDVRYRLAPEYPFPRAIGDVKCLLGRFRERAAEFGADPNRAALLGRSAGGEIALIAAYSVGDARIPPSCAVEDQPVQAVISVYGVTDLVDGHQHPLHPDLIDARQALEQYLGGAPAQQPDRYRLGSPAFWLDRAVPRTLLIHGEGDRMVRAEHSRRLAEALRAKGHSARLLLIPFADHGFDRRPGGLGEQLARGVVIDFLRPL